MFGQSDPIKPLCKQADIEMHTVGDHFVIYEASSDAVHYLNPTAALILELCDGFHTSGNIAAEVQQAYGLDYTPVAEVTACIETLASAKLISQVTADFTA